MIKALGQTPDGTPLVVLGLSDENWARLRAGRPIWIGRDAFADGSPEAHVLPVAIALIGGPDEESLREDLRSLGAPVPAGGHRGPEQ